MWRAVIAAKPPLTTCAACPKHLSLNRNWAVTESLQLNGSLIECRASHEFEMANAAKFFGLVKSPSMVVVSVTARERSEHRSLVFAVSLSSRTRTEPLRSTSEIELMLFLSAAYVFGCAFRSFLPRADIQRICLFDTWLSSATVGRSVATVAEICFAAQWAIVLYQLGTMTGADTTLSAAWVIVPLILIAECLSWHAVLTKNDLGNAIENSIWGVSFFVVGIALCRLLPEFEGPVAVVLVIAIIGITGYLLFLATVDVPMYLTRWRAETTDSSRQLSPLAGLRDASVRWVVTHDIAEWKNEIAWMSLYFSAAVWASLALCVCYSFAGIFRAFAPKLPLQAALQTT